MTLSHTIGQDVSLFIDGALVPSVNETPPVDVINPSNGQHLMSIPSGCADDVERAVASSRRAFEDGRWSDAPLSVRKKALHKFADLVAGDAHLDALDAEEMGKPVSTSAYNAQEAAALMRFNAEAIDKITGDTYTSDRQSFIAQRRVPRGVVAAVVPWNFPTFNAVLKIAPAIAAGNCVVLKPSELASRSALRLARMALEAGIPEGVLNVTPGLGDIVGRAYPQ